MKNQHKITQLAITLLLTLSHFTGHAQQTAPNHAITYQLDTKQSKILWEATRNKHYGFILFNSGSLSANIAGHPLNGTFSINMNAMKSTDDKEQKYNDETDGLLKSDKYFSVARYPTATMVVLTIAPTDNPVKFKVSGKLTIKSYTNPVEFIATIKPIKNDIKITANFKIDRMKWHVTGETENFIYSIKDNLKDALIADEIPISLDLLFYQQP